MQRLKTSGGEENIAPVEVKFVTGGNYSVSARLISADEPARSGIGQRRLAEARKSRPAMARADRSGPPEDRSGAADLPQIRAELKSMLDDKPAAPLASLLDSAWRELN